MPGASDSHLAHSSPAGFSEARTSLSFRSGVALLFALGLTFAAHAEDFSAPVVGVTDGDTITVLRNHRHEALRLHGIDAPEKGQAFGERAKQFTSSLVFGKNVAVRVRGRDRYGRTLADVFLPDGRNLNQEVVRSGYAWWYRRYSADQRLAVLEAEARATHRGLWADPNPQPPWEWRKGRPQPDLQKGRMRSKTMSRGSKA
jgi:endonuclease YncB( thermonuclease family)